MKKTLWLTILLILSCLICAVFGAACSWKESDPPASEQESEDEAKPDADGGDAAEEEHEHDFGSWETIKMPTCAEEGSLRRECHCGEVETRSMDVLPHTEVVDSAVDPTCTSEGKTEGKHCSVCKKVIVEQTVIPMLPHTEETDEGVKATCTAEGKTEGKHCSVCNIVIVEQTVISMLPHTEVVDEGVKATCTTAGKTEGKHCSVCNTVTVAQTTIKKTAHTEVVVPGYPATCTSTGKTDGKRCSVCNTTTMSRKNISKLPHDEIVTEAGVEATCLSEGISDGKKCSVCQQVTSVPTVLPKVDHGYSTWTVIEYATEESSGSRTRSCRWCEKTENAVIDPIRYDGALGSAGKIAETTVVVSIFANDLTTSWDFEFKTDKAMMDTMHTYLASAATWLEKQCGSYGASTDFIYDWRENPDLFYTVDFGDFKMVRTDSGGYRTQQSWIREEIDSEELKQRYNAQNIIYILYFNTDETNTVNSWCISDIYGTKTEEVINIFVRDTYDTGGYYVASASTFAHEMLHCFGAFDLYYQSWAIPKAYVEYCQTSGSRDIMYTVNLGATITPKFTQLCAYYVGLVDECPEVEKWGLAKSTHLK